MINARAQSALEQALGRVIAAASDTSDRVVDALGIAAVSASNNTQRQSFLSAQFDLRRRLPAFNLAFSKTLREKVLADVEPSFSQSRSIAATDWQSLSLVGDDEEEERMSAERLSIELAHDCEWELRELTGYMGSLLGHDRPEPEHNPLRPELIGRALFRGIEAASDEAETRKLLARELGRGLSKAMRQCYAAIIGDLRGRGVQPVGLAVKTVDGPGNELPREYLREGSGYKVPVRDSTFAAQALSSMFGVAIPAALAAASSAGALGPPSTRSGAFGGIAGSNSAFGAAVGAGGSAAGGAGAASLFDRSSWDTSGHGGMGLRDVHAARGTGAGSPDASLNDLIRRLAFLGAQSAEAERPHAAAAGGQSTGPGSLGSGARTSGWHPTGGSASPGFDAITGLMAANLIRTHREDLMRASTGALDHMVIDVVSALFDQVLSDAKVPPQMARQIARLQLPVLRVALQDVGFFNTRKHPVRRFVNRIATLAAGFEDFDEGPGAELLGKVRELVQQIVEGDFDQMAVYESKLSELEELVQAQAARDAGGHAGVATLLDNRETELRIQQRYMRELQVRLKELPLHDFVREFLAQVWSQVQVQSAPDAQMAERMKETARELVMSVQPKGDPQLRKEFLIKLPRLMKDLNEGLALIRWPEAAKKDFFAKLLPAHAESLKVAPLTDFATRQLKFQLDQVQRVVIPTAADLKPAEAHAELAIEPQEHAAPLEFSPEEAEQIGLIAENAVDWDGKVDIDLNAASGVEEVDIALDGAGSEQAPAPGGIALMHHLQPGIAYQMFLKDKWQRVRLSWVSPGRAFFVFTHGKGHRKTVSMTSRMLAKMCETQRLRPYEQAELLERATARARKQLAQLSNTSSTRRGDL